MVEIGSSYERDPTQEELDKLETALAIACKLWNEVELSVTPKAHFLSNHLVKQMKETFVPSFEPIDIPITRTATKLAWLC